MLDKGEVAETGTHSELMARNGLYAHFFNEQAQWYETEAAL
jgi:ABC-type multidrug transport system fused ATPase/permease subunit